MKFQINGIQQLGVGVPDINEAWKWYNNNFGVDVKVVDETAVAQFMLPHTGGKPRERRAIIAISMQGGGGLEIWQHTGKTPEMPKFQIQLGDLGISVGKMKTLDAQKAYDTFKAKGLNLLTEVVSNPMGTKHFYLMDPYQNIWEFVEDSFVFDASKGVNGGAFGAVIGVVDVEKSLEVYRDILGYDVVVYDKEGVFEDFNGVPGGGDKFRRVLLAMSNPAQGAFSPLFGPSQIELVQVSGREPKTIFEAVFGATPASFRCATTSSTWTISASLWHQRVIRLPWIVLAQQVTSTWARPRATSPTSRLPRALCWSLLRHCAFR